MTLLKNWPSRLAALVELARACPFAWGSHDCCMWAADSVLALTGRDPAAQWRGTYRTEREALALVARLGGLPAIGAMCGKEIAPAFAVAGDIGLVTWPDGVMSLGVSSGNAWMCAGDFGLVFLPDESTTRAWGVGHE